MIAVIKLVTLSACRPRRICLVAWRRKFSDIGPYLQYTGLPQGYHRGGYHKNEYINIHEGYQGYQGVYHMSEYHVSYILYLISQGLSIWVGFVHTHIHTDDTQHYSTHTHLFMFFMYKPGFHIHTPLDSPDNPDSLYIYIYIPGDSVSQRSSVHILDRQRDTAVLKKSTFEEDEVLRVILMCHVGHELTIPIHTGLS